MYEHNLFHVSVIWNELKIESKEIQILKKCKLLMRVLTKGKDFTHGLDTTSPNVIYSMSRSQCTYSQIRVITPYTHVHGKDHWACTQSKTPNCHVGSVMISHTLLSMTYWCVTTLTQDHIFSSTSRYTGNKICV